ncbi:hypothetical protein C8R42DRAFT_437961 [Lentinula raphanica]|nr:hypothetical protein C8R42DRAFT_437961 [Lentinula raphanica]
MVRRPVTFRFNRFFSCVSLCVAIFVTSHPHLWIQQQYDQQYSIQATDNARTRDREKAKQRSDHAEISSVSANCLALTLTLNPTLNSTPTPMPPLSISLSLPFIFEYRLARTP